MTILGIGEIVLDKVNVLNNHPLDGEKIQATQTNYTVGGPVPSALILLSKLGLNCTMIGNIGNDPAGRLLNQMMKKYNINLFSKLQRNTKTNTVLVNSQNGSRTIIKDQARTKPLCKIPQDLIRSADIIIFDRHEPLAFQQVIKHKRKNTKIVIDPSTEISPKTLEMIKHADYPIIPIESLQKMSLSKLYQIAKRDIIVTLGDRGSLIFNRKGIRFFPAYNIKAIDTLGAGDVFRGAYAYGVAQKWSKSRMIKFANMVSALQCTRIGNGTAIPTLQEIINFEKSAKPKKLTIKHLNLNI